jgi:general secretion pathway protein L
MHLPLRSPLTWDNARAGLRTFLSWWQDELRALVPPEWSVFARGLFQRRTVIADGSEWRLGVPGSTDEWISLDTAEANAGLRTTIARLDPGAQQQRVDVTIPMRDGFVRHIHLPAAAEPRLRQVVSFQIERLSPLRAPDVRFDCRKLGDNDDGTIEVVVGIVPTATLREYTLRLESLGLAPKRFALSGSDLAFAPVDKDWTHHERLQLALGAATLALWLAAIVLAPWLRQGELDRLSQELAALRAPAAAALSTRDQLLDIQATVAAAAEEATRPSALDSLRFLTDLLPDDVQLSELVIDDGNVRLTGTARDPRRLVLLLNRSRRFHTAHLVGPFITDSKGRATFQIEAPASGATGRTP